MGRRMRIAILGSGNIGTDLLIKVARSEWLECGLFVGRNFSSPGMVKAASLCVKMSDQSINAIVDNADTIDLVFDATSAKDHLYHAPILKSLGIRVIDMTPARIGKLCVPAVNMKECLSEDNINMVTCGGQASIPIAWAISRAHPGIDYIEVVSSIASRSAGPATRINLDEYIGTTEYALQQLTGCVKAKAILNLNPAVPCVNMQTTVYAKIGNPNMDLISQEVDAVVQRIQQYVPGYQLLVEPTYENNRVIVMVRAVGLGDYLPSYAGNLDIINCAAIAVAEEYAKSLTCEG
ncbi:MAG: acetaldehyde dehydrogenase (acetylating) [Negativicutes bacterium]|jgi:acetaldehyde dehydrogenase